MTKDLNELIQISRARELTDAMINKMAGPRNHTAYRTYLAAKIGPRSDLPDTARIVRMSENVIRRLEVLELHEPVCLEALAEYWWKVNVDAAEVGKASEYGCGYVTLFLKSERLEDIGFEVIDGPFKEWESEEISRAILNSHPGKFWDARIFKDVNSGYDDGYASEDLLAALDSDQIIQVLGGPYDTKDAAQYALDLRWESPE